MSLCILSSATAEPKITVVTSIPPLQSLTQAVLGDRGRCQALAKGDMDPHAFELGFRGMELLNSADVIVFNGLFLEFWAEKLDSKLTEKIITLQDALPSGNGDMHTWLDPVIVGIQTQFLADALCKKLSSSCSQFQFNAQKSIAELKALDTKLKIETASWKHKAFVSFHPAWTRLAERYNLIQVGSLKEHDQNLLGTKKFFELISAARSEHARAVVVSLGEESQGEAIAEVLEIPVVTLDEYGAEGEGLPQLIERNMMNLGKVLQ